MGKSCPDPDGTESSSLKLHATALKFSAWKWWLGCGDGRGGGTVSDGDGADGGPGGGVTDGGAGGGFTGSDCDDGGCGGGAPSVPSLWTSLNPDSDDVWFVGAMMSKMRS